jgi:hypothetical protein
LEYERHQIDSKLQLSFTFCLCCSCVKNLCSTATTARDRQDYFSLVRYDRKISRLSCVIVVATVCHIYDLASWNCGSPSFLNQLGDILFDDITNFPSNFQLRNTKEHLPYKLWLRIGRKWKLFFDKIHRITSLNSNLGSRKNSTYTVTFFFTEAPKKTSGFRSTEQTVKISVQFCDFWSSVIQVYKMNLQFFGSIRKNFGSGNGSFWKKKTFFLSFLSCLGLEPRIFGFKVNN